MSFTQKFAAENPEFMDYLIITWVLADRLKIAANKLIDKDTNPITLTAIDGIKQAIEMIEENHD